MSIEWILHPEYGWQAFWIKDFILFEEIKPMNTVTQEQIDRIVAASVVDSLKVGTKTTVVVITLPNGFEIVGTSACVDPKNYNHDIGTEYAKKRAIDKIWELEGYRLQSIITETK